MFLEFKKRDNTRHISTIGKVSEVVT